MNKVFYFVLLVLFLSLKPSIYGAETAVTTRDSQGRTIGTETTRNNADGSSTTTYRNSEGKTTGTATERTNSDGSVTTTYRDAQGRTTGTKTTRK